MDQFASMTKKECPCTSGGITVSQNTPNYINNLDLHMYTVQFTNWVYTLHNQVAHIVYIHNSP